MSFPSNLDVPVVYQEDDFSCTPVCIKMVLEFVRNENPEGYIPDLDVEQISEAIGTDELGTALENVDKINKELEKSVPSVEFVTKLNCSFSEIEDEILGGKPVIAWIRMPYPHSVVVTGLNKELLVIFLNDPQQGKSDMKMGRFMSAWERNDNVLIKAKIGEKIQRIIPEYDIEREERREE